MKNVYAEAQREVVAQREKTARLRALRLAREQTTTGVLPTAKPAKPVRKAASSSSP